jgi:hypothetical protein
VGRHESAVFNLANPLADRDTITPTPSSLPVHPSQISTRDEHDQLLRTVKESKTPRSPDGGSRESGTVPETKFVKDDFRHSTPLERVVPGPGFPRARTDIVETRGSQPRRVPSLVERVIGSRKSDKNNARAEQDGRPEPTTQMSGLEMLAAKRGGQSNQAASADTKLPTFAPPSVSKSSLTLPKRFSQMSEHEQEVLKHHETLKERKRDLDALGSVFWECALLLCFPDRDVTERTTQTEQEEIYEIAEFVEIVINQNKSGRLKRKRIQDIRDNIKRRVTRASETCITYPADAAILEEMRRTFGARCIDFVDDEVPKVQAEIDHWGNLRRSLSNKHHRNQRKSIKTAEAQNTLPAKKKVQFGRESSKKASSWKSYPNTLVNATENRQQAQYTRLDDLQTRLRLQLQMFETADPENVLKLQDQVAETQAQLKDVTLSVNDDSEEEDGAEHVFAAGSSHISESHPEQDLTELDRLENRRQQKDRVSADSVKQRQAFDPELLRQMQLRKARAVEATTDPTIIQSSDTRDDSDESDLEGKAIDNSDESDTFDNSEAEEEEQKIYRYTVWGTFRNVPGYDDVDHYRLARTYNNDSAEAKVRSTIADIPSRLCGVVDNPQCGSILTEWDWDSGGFEQHYMLGKEVDVEARVWSERELVDLTKRRLRQAKRHGPVREPDCYAVYWQSTLTPIPVENEDEMEIDSAEQDSLFGDETPEGKTRTPTVKTIPSDEVTFYRDSILANRRAKEIWVEWMSTFFPGVESEGYLRQEDDALEQELKQLGATGLFWKEDYFIVPGTIDGHGRAKEEMKVWVKRIPVMGPGN